MNEQINTRLAQLQRRTPAGARLTCGNISRETGIPVQTVSSLTRRALVKFRTAARALEEDYTRAEIEAAFADILLGKK